MTSWWQAPFRMMQTNLRLIDADMDVDSVAREIREHGADAWLFSVGGIFANHPSSLDSQLQNPYLAGRESGDLVKDAMEAARRHGLRFVARMDFSKVTPAIAARHPEWLYRAADGRRQVFNGLTTTCPSADYFQHEIFAILDEVMDRYPVDGMFFNWFNYSEFAYSYEYFGPCHCDACTTMFSAETGLNLPVTRQDDAYPAWKAWSRRMLLDLGERITLHIHRRLPEAGLILSDTADLRYIEANNGVGREPWRHLTTETVSAALTHLPDVPVLVNCVSFLDFPYRMGAEEPERFAQYLIQAFSRGASFSTYIMGYPGRIDYPSLPLAAELTRFHSASQAWYDGLRQDSPVLLLSGGAHVGLTPAPPQVREFRGMYLALQETHVPFDVLNVAHIESLGERLQTYRLVVLPDLGELSSRASEILDKYVAAGGRLVATGSSGIDRFGDVTLSSLGSSSRIEVSEGERLLSTYVQVAPGRVVPVHGAFHCVLPREGSKRGMPFMPPARYGPPEFCYGHEASDHPGVLYRHFGSGRSAHLPWTVGRAYLDIGTTNLRDVVTEVLTELLPDGVGIETDLPAAIEMVVGRSSRGTLVHLVSHLHATDVSYREPVAVSGHTLTVEHKGDATATSLITGQRLDTRTDGDRISISLPPIGRFDAIAIGNPQTRGG